MNCPKCQTDLTDKNTSCPNCGTAIQNNTTSAAPSPASDAKPAKKKISLLKWGLIIFLAAVIITVATIAIVRYCSMRGTCGTNLTWVYDGKGTLTISGRGQMENYFEHKYTETPECIPGWYKFRNEIKLVVIEEGVTSVGFGAFYCFEEMEEIIIPDTVKSIGEFAFERCGLLQEITIPDGVEIIDCATFFNCKKLSRISIPDTVTVIGSFAFEGCSALTDISLPDQLTTIETAAFDGCSSLKNVILPDQLTTIESDAFRETGLESITIPASVTSLGPCAFYDCSKLSEVFFRGDMPFVKDKFSYTFEVNVFKNVTATIYYPSRNGTWEGASIFDLGGNLKWHSY